MFNGSCIVLNSSFEPLDIKSTKDALIDILTGKAYAVKEYEHTVRSQHLEFRLPSVIALKKYVHSKRNYSKKAVLTQRNLFTRDNHRCQYCGRYNNQFSSGEILTRDHIKPRSRGGKDVWENVTTACSTCNNKKDNMTLKESKMRLRQEPHTPTVFELFAKTKLMRDFRLDKLYEEVM